MIPRRCSFSLRASRGAAALALFLFGCGPDEPESEGASELVFPRLQHMIYLPAENGQPGLFVDRFEVTDGDFQRFLEETGYRPSSPRSFLSHWQEDGAGGRRPPRPREPVRWVDLADADAYARWAGKSLPTQSEWMRATSNTLANMLRMGLAERACNCLEFRLGRVTDVGVLAFSRSEYGCFDLLGNVAEWTTSAQPEPADGVGATNPSSVQFSSPSNRRVMGGSFRSTMDSRREVFVDPLTEGEWVSKEVRRYDLGFRCVVRDAERVIADCVETIQSLSGPARDDAITELLATGIYRDIEEQDELRGREWFARNAILHQIGELDLRSRVRWRMNLDPSVQAVEVRRSPVPGADGCEDLLVFESGRLLLVAGSTGEVVDRLDLPGLFFRPRVQMLQHGDRAALCIEASNGDLTLVELPRRPEGERRLRAVSIAFPEAAHVAAVQARELVEIDWRGGADGSTLVLTEGVRQPGDTAATVLKLHDAQGQVSAERIVSGSFRDLQEPQPDVLLLATEERISVKFEHPFSLEDAWELEPVCSLLLHVLDRRTLEVLATRRLNADAARVDQATVHSFRVGSSEYEDVFLERPARAEAERVLVSLPSVLRRKEEGVLRHELHLLSLPGLEPLAEDSFLSPFDEDEKDSAARGRGFEHSASLSRTTLPSVLIGKEPGGAVRVAHVGPEDAVQTEVLSVGDRVDEAQVDGEWWTNGESVRSGPLYLAEELGPSIRLHLDRLRIGADTNRARLEPVLPPISVQGRPSQRLAAFGRAEHLLSFDGNQALCIDLDQGRIAWQGELRPVTVSSLEVDLDDDPRYSVLIGKSAYELWACSIETGRMQDEIVVRRAGIESFARVDLDGEGEREWVVVADGGVLPSPDSSRRVIAALGPSTSVLLDEFQRVLEEYEKGVREGL